MSVGQDDPYEILGIPRDARLEEIERAFRRLAFLYHPDKRAGDPRAEEAFRKITAAYATVRRIAEEVAQGMPPPPPEPAPEAPGDSFVFEPRESPAGRTASKESWEAPPKPSGDPFVQAFYEPPLGDESERAPVEEEPPVTKRTLRISFLDAVRGGSRPLEIRHGIPFFGRRARRIEVKIPPGIANGTILRLRGAGFPARRGGPAGDLLLKVIVKSEPGERRDGADVHSEATVPLSTAILGGRIVVQTVRGRALLEVPPRCPPGAEFRLRGAGMLLPDGSRGDHVVRIQVRWPRHITAEQAKLLREWEDQGSASPAPAGLWRRLWPFRRRNPG